MFGVTAALSAHIMGQMSCPQEKPMQVDKPMKVLNEQNEAQLEMETEGKHSITGITVSTRLSPATLQSGATTKPGECLMGALVNWNHRGILWKLEMEIMHLEYQFSSISLLKVSVGMG